MKNLTEELDKIKRSQTIKVKELEGLYIRVFDLAIINSNKIHYIAQLEDALKMKMEQLQKTREAHDQEVYTCIILHTMIQQYFIFHSCFKIRQYGIKKRLL